MVYKVYKERRMDQEKKLLNEKLRDFSAGIRKSVRRIQKELKVQISAHKEERRRKVVNNVQR